MSAYSSDRKIICDQGLCARKEFTEMGKTGARAYECSQTGGILLTDIHKLKEAMALLHVKVELTKGAGPTFTDSVFRKERTMPYESTTFFSDMNFLVNEINKPTSNFTLGKTCS